MKVSRNDKSCQIGRRLAKQGPRVPVQASAGREKYAKMATLKIIQVNIAGLQNKSEDLERLLHKHKAHAALIQKTILPEEEIKLPSGYTSYKCSCENCQGIMTLIRSDIQATVEHCPIDDIDIQKATIWFGKEKFKVYNVYCPPPSKTELTLMEAIHSKTIVAGDSNAHMPRTGYSSYNKRGHNIEDLINSSNLNLHQNETTEPTLFHRRHSTRSKPDLTLSSSDITEQTSVEVVEYIGGDHDPILISIVRQPLDKPRKKRKCPWNFKKANWSLYGKLTDKAFTEIPAGMSIEEAHKKICSSILECAKKAIPRGNRKKYKQFWSPELQEAVKERQHLRKVAIKDPCSDNKQAFNKATGKVRHLIKKAKRESWRTTCESLNLRKDSRKAWTLHNSLTGTAKRTNPKPLNHDDRLITNPRKKANQNFC